ncbi:MAG: hypothetical protein RIQ54_47 [Candidatus Parcubacteria bacterium]|jgi:glycosyltransferase involved in cell wall biosynthesis
MKINLTLLGAKLTGGSFNLMEVAHRLGVRGYDVVVTTTGELHDLDWFTKTRTPAFDINITPLVGTLAYRIYRRVLRGTILTPFPDVEMKDLMRSIPNCDINIATTWPTAFSVFRSGKGVPLYYFQHLDSLFSKDLVSNTRHDEALYLPIQKYVCSTWLKERTEERLKIKVNGVLTAGIDRSVYHPQIRQNKKIKILSLGRKVEWKGFSELQQAMAALYKKNKNIEWIVYSSHDTPKSTVEAPFTLVKSPYGKQLADLYAQCDIVVNPSWHEGFAQPALEGMASGCAVVTTPYGAEDFAKDKQNCLVIDAKNSKAIENAIQLLLDDSVLREGVAAGGLETAQQFYWDNIIDQWEKVLAK